VFKGLNRIAGSRDNEEDLLGGSEFSIGYESRDVWIRKCSRSVRGAESVQFLRRDASYLAMSCIVTSLQYILKML